MAQVMSRLAVVVPVYGNEPSLRELYERIVRAAEAAGVLLTLQFVNDRSPDGSQAVLEDLAARDPRVRVVLLSRNHGSFVAIAAGLAQVADHDAAVVLAADLQDPPELIGEMVEQWRRGKKVVLCARTRRDDPLASRLFSQGFHWLFRTIALREMPPGGFDVFLIDRAVIRVILESAEKKTSLVGLVLWAGFDRAVIPYERSRRPHGKSAWSFGRKLAYAFHSIAAFSSVPLKLFALLGAGLAVLSLASLLYVLAASLAGVISIQGWPSLIMAQLLTITLLSLGFGILGGYLWINLEQTRRRPLYIIDKSIGGPGRDDSPRGPIPLQGPAAPTASAARDLRQAAGRVLRASRLILGPEVSRFEHEFAARLGSAHCVGVANGTDALTLALWACGVVPGGRVAVPALASPSTAVAVLRAGCVPVFVDVDPATLCLDPAGLDDAAALGATAVVCLHPCGRPCDMDALSAQARRLNLTLVEDCAQSVGSTFNGTPCGRFGRAAAFAFPPGALLGACGDAGAVVTDDPALAQALRRMRSQGLDASGQCVTAGLHSRLDEMQAALLLENMQVLESNALARRRIASAYDEALDFLDPLPPVPGWTPNAYVARPRNRESFQAHLRARGVETGVPYPLALNRHAHLAAHGLGGPCPAAETACARVVTLPCHPCLSQAAQHLVIEACLSWRDRGEA